MIKSKFQYRAALPLLLLVILIAAFSVLGYLLFFMPNDGTITTGIYAAVTFVLLFFLLVAFWLTVEIRKKLIVVRVDSNLISISSFYGLGPEQKFDSRQLDGYTTTLLPVMYGTTYEYLYIIKDGKQVCALSAFYHHNYAELKQALSGRLKFIGENTFEMAKEIKDTFR